MHHREADAAATSEITTKNPNSILCPDDVIIIVVVDRAAGVDGVSDADVDAAPASIGVVSWYFWQSAPPRRTSKQVAAAATTA